MCKFNQTNMLGNLYKANIQTPLESYLNFPFDTHAANVS